MPQSLVAAGSDAAGSDPAGSEAAGSDASGVAVGSVPPVPQAASSSPIAIRMVKIRQECFMPSVLLVPCMGFAVGYEMARSSRDSDLGLPPH